MTYGPDPAHRAGVYTPPGDSPFPEIVLVHGGGFVGGGLDWGADNSRPPGGWLRRCAARAACGARIWGCLEACWWGGSLGIGALRSAVDAAVGGGGGVVLLAGEAGMGKTALAAEAVVFAKARGAVAVWGACWEGDGAPGFWPWIQVVRELAGDSGEETGRAVLAELTRATGARGGILGDESAVRLRTYDVAVRYLRGRAAQRPLVVVVDDLQWADVSSLRLLVFLARHLRDAAVLVIGTYRDVEVAVGDHPVRRLLGELAGQAELVQLAGLTAGEVGELLEMVCGEQPPTVLVRAVHDRTGGNPFFVRQIARLLASQGAPLDRAPVTGVPPAVGDVLSRRLARLPAEVMDLLAVASVVGRRFGIAMVAAVAGATTEVAVRLVDGAVRAAVLEQDGPGRSVRCYVVG